MRNIHTLNPLKGAFGWSCLDNILYAVFSLTCYSQFFDFEMVFFGRMVHGHRKQLKVSSTRLALLHTRTSSSRFRSGCLEKPTSIWRVWKLKMELPTDIWMAISKKSLSLHYPISADWERDFRLTACHVFFEISILIPMWHYVIAPGHSTGPRPLQ